MTGQGDVNDIYDIALSVCDEVLGEGTYARINKDNHDPAVQAAIARASRCSATMTQDATHTHTCSGVHDAGDHYCPTCRRWWWARDPSA